MRSSSLDRASAVEFALGSEVRLVCEIGGRESAEIQTDSRHVYARPVFTALPTDAQKPSRVWRVWLPPILRILGSRHVAEVNPSVIRLNPIDVVNIVIRPYPVHKNPGQSVSFEPVLPNSQADVPIVSNGPSFYWSRQRNNTTCSSDACVSHDDTSLRVVVKQLAQALRGKIGLSHDVPPVRIGQRPARVDSTGGLRHFITRACSVATGITKRLHKFARPARLLFAHACKLPQNSQPSWGIDPANSF